MCLVMVLFYNGTKFKLGSSLNPDAWVEIHHIQSVLQFDGGDTKEIRIEVLSEGEKGIVVAYRP